MAKKNRSRTGKKGMMLRRNADKHKLYQWAVQAPDFEVDFIDTVFQHHRGRRPKLLREDFCGTALLSAEWARSRNDRQAIGLDLDQETLDWAREHNLNSQKGNKTHVQLLRKDVRTVTSPKTDVICAFNFSYYTFFPFRDLVTYLKKVRKSLKSDGLLFLDAFGGWESQQVLEEAREISSPEGKFIYVWDQADFNPIDNSITCHIHFQFAGGKRMKKAFTYQWRLYSPAEVCDALEEAGFSGWSVYWDKSEKEDYDDYRLMERAENTPGWLAYIVGIV